MQLFTDIQEQALMKYIITCSKLNYGLTINNIRSLSYEFAIKCGIDYPTGWNESKRASKDWYYGFMKRHPNLSLRKPEPTSAHRAKGFCKENVDEFFDNLKKVLAEHTFEPHRISYMES